MKPRLATPMIWSAMAALALTVLALLVRNMLAIPAHVPLDPNEGWNAAHAMRWVAGHGLYPPPATFMVNNYPPLSFYAVGALARWTGDFIVAGRVLSLAAFLAVCAGIAAALRAMGCGPRGQWFAALFFATVLLIASDYVGMDDPQLLGHAVQVAALLLALRGRSVLAALLFALSLFIKHNLLALPLAVALWLCWQDRRAGLRFVLGGIGFAALGLLAFRLTYGIGLLAQMASPRRSSLVNIESTLPLLYWAALPALSAAILPRNRWSLLCWLYGGIALALGLIFSAGNGVDLNASFDLAIALSLALGLSLERGRRPLLAAACAVPPLLFLAFNFTDNNFFFTRDFAAQSARDIAFLKARPGPALCDQLSLCLWAGKAAEVDVFNIGEQIESGARDPAPLARQIAAHRFAVLQLEDLDALGPRIRAAIARNYRADHADDNGIFLVPVRPAP